MLPTPNSLIFLMVVSAACGVWLTYVMRTYCTNARNVPSPSKIFEHFACISLMIAMSSSLASQRTRRRRDAAPTLASYRSRDLSCLDSNM